MKKGCLLLVIIVLTSIQFSQAQKVNQIKGLLKDSLHNYVVQGASVSIFKEGATKLTKVSLSDNKGQFIMEDIPENTAFRLEISHQNYDKITRDFTLTKGQILNFKQINLSFKENVLNEVVIIPPVRMNGDTLEFNANAFDLDTNAVVEDLLNKLPGVMVWGDGKITSNGKEIKSVLVDGKPFFGVDHRIAVQNIAKDAVEKIQIYDRRSPEQKAENVEPDHEMNIVLKQGKKDGYFGKAGNGYGSRERYDGDVSFNLYSPKSQATAAFSSNNVNKRMYSIDQLLPNSTFKGVGISSGFDPDFRKSGITKQHVAGISLQHDFQKSTSVQKRNLIKFSYLGLDEQANFANSSIINYITSTNENQSNTTEDSSKSINNNRDHSLRLNYELNNENLSLLVLPSFKTYSKDHNSSNTSIYDYQSQQTESKNFNSGESEGNEFNLDIRFSKNPYAYNPARNKWYNKLRPDFESTTRYFDNRTNSITHSETINHNDNSLNQTLNRAYNSDHKGFAQDLSLDLPDVLSALYTKSQKLFRVGLNQKLKTINGSYNQNILDNETIENSSLSYRSTYSKILYTPNVQLSKSIYNTLYGRFNKALTTTIDFEGLIVHEDYISSLDYRNLERSLQYFTPSISANYSNSINNISNKYITLKWNQSVDITSLDQLHPIYDDINIVNRFYGNPNLTSPSKQTFSLSYRYHNTIGLGYNYQISLSAVKWKNGITDSIIYRDNGTREAYLTNMKDDVWSTSLNAQISKPFKINDYQNISLEFNTNQTIGSKFQYINQERDESNNFNSTNGLQLYYSAFDKFKLSTTHSLSYYKLKSKTNANNDYSTTYRSSGLSISYAFTKKWSVNSNINWVDTKSRYSTDNSTIWNANTTYRALKGNNLEIKFSALDLLRDNKGIFVTSSVDSYTTGTRNNLQQYFMLSLSYYPRKFGLKGL